MQASRHPTSHVIIISQRILFARKAGKVLTTPLRFTLTLLISRFWHVRASCAEKVASCVNPEGSGSGGLYMRRVKRLVCRISAKVARTSSKVTRDSCKVMRTSSKVVRTSSKVIRTSEKVIRLPFFRSPDAFPFKAIRKTGEVIRSRQELSELTFKVSRSSDSFEFYGFEQAHPVIGRMDVSLPRGNNCHGVV